MSTTDDILRYRQGVLLACAGALLHNLGKVSSRFVEMQCGELSSKGKRYFYQHVVGLFLDDCGRDVESFLRPYKFKNKKQQKQREDLSKHLGQSTDVTAQVLQDATKEKLKTPISFPLPKPFNDRSYRIGDLIEYLSQGEPFYSKPKGHSEYLIQKLFSPSSLLTHLMNRCHHGASGGEKDAIYRLKQSLPLYLATPFGFEQLAPDLTGYDEIKDKVEEIIQKYLEPGSLKNPFVLGEFARKLEPLLRRIPADTQRGVNDITVWDIGHSGMAFLKAGIWSLYGKTIKHDDLAEGESSLHPRWRLWRVGLNGLEFLTGAVSVADLRVRQRLLRKYLDAVRDFAEEKYPVATAVYRDENGEIYIFPDWEEKSSEYETFTRELAKALPEKGSGSTLSLPELYGLRPATQLSEKNYHNHPECSGSSLKYIGEAVREWIEKPLPAAPFWEAYPDSFGTDLCPYCGVRPVGSEKLHEKLPEEEKERCASRKAWERKTCCACMGARGWIVKDWWEKAPFSTVWVDEVADTNGRVALVVGKFGVEKMLVELVYPGVLSYRAKMKRVTGSLPSAGTSFVCDNTKFRVIQSVPPDELEAVASSKVHPFRGLAKLVAIDFSSCKATPTTGRQVLSDPFEVKFKNVVSGHSGKYELECENDTKILEQCRKFTGRENIKWKQLQGVVFEFDIKGQRVNGKVIGTKKVEIDRNPAENLLLWTNGSGSYFYVVEKCEEIKLSPFLKDWNDWVSKGARVFPAPSASFARFRRVWETTARFWQEVAPLKEQVEDWQKGLSGCLAVTALEGEGTRRRLNLKLRLEKPRAIAAYHAYELEVAGVSIGIVPTDVQDDRVTGVTIENLGYIAKQLGAPKKVCTDPYAAAMWVTERLLAKGDGGKERPPRIRAAQGYGHGKIDCGAATIEDVRLAEKDYHPVIPVLANPRIFAVLLPASAAVKLVRRIHKKYAEEMGKVRWRLPLTLGTVFFPRHLPLRIVLAAGWRLLERAGKFPGAKARVIDAVHPDLSHPTPGSRPACVTVEAELLDPAPGQHGRRVKLKWEVPTAMGDRCTFDIWYPWVKLADQSSAPPDRPLSFQHEGVTWLHVMELKSEDEIEFYPSTWDFVFLENAGERFTIAYDESGRRLGLGRRPYYMEEIDQLVNHWEKLREHLSSTQRHALWQTLLERYARWVLDESGAAQPAPPNDDSWQRFCRDTLLNAGWERVGQAAMLNLIGKTSADWPSLETLTGAAASGLLFDLFELFMTILKEGE